MLHPSTLSGDRWRLSRSQYVAYALPLLGITFLGGAFNVLQGIYAKDYGLALTTISTVLLASRLFDAISDPLVAYFSDRYYERTGNRRPFILAGGLIFIVSAYFLFTPPEAVSGGYFLFWFVLYFLGTTLFDISHTAWGGEMGLDSQGKTELYAWRAVAFTLGPLLFFALPLLPVFETSAFTPQTLHWSVVLVGLFLLPALYLCFQQVPVQQQAQARAINKPASLSLPRILLSVLTNKSFLWFLAALVCAGTGVGMCFTLMIFFVDAYLGKGEQFSWLLLISFAASTACIPLWGQLVIRFGRFQIWSGAMLITAAGVFGMAQLNPDSSTLALQLFMIMAYSGFSALGVIVPPILLDVIDYGRWKSSQSDSAMYFSINNLVGKSNMAIGGAIALAIVSAYGFEPAAMEHSDRVVMGLRLAMGYLPVPLILLSIVCFALMPLDSRRHRIIRRRLESEAKQSDTPVTI